MSTRSNGSAVRAHALPTGAETQTLGIAFFDLSRFNEWFSSEQDDAAIGFLQHVYELTAELEAHGCRVVKFMGDAGLVVFEPEHAEVAIFALCAFSEQVRDDALAAGFDSWCNINIHVGDVVTGSFGSPGREQFDVLGKAVNVAARLGRRGVIMSPQAFRTLSTEARDRFQKITRPVTYAFRG
ncbi:MAG: adenylate/guanylate cyclase domain-containing protein [Pseudomonadota bacterium]